jgi:N6-adenosine-specific RNA methylase IME4
MNELNIKKETLPENIIDLKNYILFTEERLKAVSLQLKTINKFDLSKDVYEVKLKEAQEVASQVLDAKVKMGELLNNTERKYVGSIAGTNVPKQEKTLPAGIDKKKSHEYQELYKNKDLVEQEKEESFNADDIPTSRNCLRLIKQKQQIEKFEELKKTSIENFNGLYDVVVIDPPWQIEKIDRDITPEQTGFDYPTMTIEEILKIKIPAKDDCHLFLWITQKYLPKGFDILNIWGFKYIVTFVWHKNGGFQPFNLPQYNCEFILYARKGSPQFIDTKNFFTCFSADRKGHSVKPNEFYETIKRVTYGKRIDIFSRRDIDGFDKWGNET